MGLKNNATFIIPKIMTTASWFKNIDGGCGWQVQRYKDTGGTVTDLVVLASGLVDTAKEAQQLCSVAIFWDWSVVKSATPPRALSPLPQVFQRNGFPADAPRPYREDGEIHTNPNVYWTDSRGDLRSVDRVEDSVLALMKTGRGL